MKAYLLVEGPYYQVEFIAVFSTMALAEEERARRGIGFCVSEVEFDPELSKVTEGFEKGPTYCISIKGENKNISWQTNYSIVRYRHPTKAEINSTDIWVQVISPLSYKHAEQEGLKYLESRK